MSLLIIGDFSASTVRDEVKTLFALPKPEKISQDSPEWKRFADSNNMLVQGVFDKEQGARYVQFSLQKCLRTAEYSPRSNRRPDG